MQQPLFSSSQCEIISLKDGELRYFPQWLGDNLATLYFKRLRQCCHWQQSAIRIAGRAVKIPRLNAWYGEPGTTYRYSGKKFMPLRWNRPLIGLLARLHKQLDVKPIASLNNEANQSPGFNSALVNCYRDGQDSVAWHADDEPELGSNPLIASISLGANRRFLLKRKDGTANYRLNLDHGSLLIMLPPLQRHWYHSLPKSKGIDQARINVTFRSVIVQ